MERSYFTMHIAYSVFVMALLFSLETARADLDVLAFNRYWESNWGMNYQEIDITIEMFEHFVEKFYQPEYIPAEDKISEVFQILNKGKPLHFGDTIRLCEVMGHLMKDEYYPPTDYGINDPGLNIILEKYGEGPGNGKMSYENFKEFCSQVFKPVIKAEGPLVETWYNVLKLLNGEVYTQDVRKLCINVAHFLLKTLAKAPKMVPTPSGRNRVILVPVKQEFE